MAQEESDKINSDVAAANSEELSPEQVDKMLKEQDPEFEAELNSINKDLATVEMEDLESTANSFDAEGNPIGGPAAGEMKADAHPLIIKFQKSIIVPIKNFRHRITKAVDKLTTKVAALGKKIYEGSKHILLYAIPEYIKYIISQIKVLLSKIKQLYTNFMGLSRWQRFATACVTVMFVGAFYFMAMIFKEAWLENLFHRLPTSLVQAGQPIGEATKKEDLISFNAAFPDSEYQVKLKKVVVNLRRDLRSGALPMGAFEFFLGLDSQDTAIEVRDREKEVLDRIQRAVETMTYSEVMSPTGKLRMKVKIRDSINEMLNQGRVTAVYINKMVTNH